MTEEELEKENAELKSRDCWKGCLYANGKSELIHEILQQQYNLTKAKELLKQWLQASKSSGCDNINIVTEAEQFLSEVEK